MYSVCLFPDNEVDVIASSWLNKDSTCVWWPNLFTQRSDLDRAIETRLAPGVGWTLHEKISIRYTTGNINQQISKGFNGQCSLVINLQEQPGLGPIPVNFQNICTHTQQKWHNLYYNTINRQHGNVLIPIPFPSGIGPCTLTNICYFQMTLRKQKQNVERHSKVYRTWRQLM